jgi:type IV pilus assembly protein PilM
VGGYSIIVKRINVQTMSEEQLLETIHYEAEQYIPFDINDVNLDFQIIGENKNNKNQMSVLLVAAKKDLIDDYDNLVSAAGRQARVIDVDAFALQNAFEASYLTDEEFRYEEGDGEVIALIEVGAEKTSLNILKGATSLFMRDISMGCGQVTNQIAAQIDSSIEEAEEIKIGRLTDRIPEEEIGEILSGFASEWTTEVRRAFDFFYSSFGENDISRIILSGGGANIEEIRNMLAEETEVPVEIINPFGNLNINHSKFDPTFLEQIAPQAAIAMGLALRRVDDK